MRLTFITRTERAKLRLSVEAPLSQEEYDELSAALRAWQPAVVSEGAQTVTRLLSDLEAPTNVATFLGPLDIRVMGLHLADGEIAKVTSPHEVVHYDTAHRWVATPDNRNLYGCGHGGCFATAEVTRNDA